MGKNPSSFKGPKHPVENVSWEDAVSFCEKLSELPEEKAAKRVYRLPTEAEWEYACRATIGAAFSFGDSADSLEEYGWFNERFGDTTHPVGLKMANRWGLYDMHGNVCEWCKDEYAPYESGAATDPQGPRGDSYRVLRGGCCCIESNCCRSAARNMNHPWNLNNYFGFRVQCNQMSFNSR